MSLLGLPKPSCSPPWDLWSHRGGEKGFGSALPRGDMPLRPYGVGGRAPWHDGLALPVPGGAGLGWERAEPRAGMGAGGEQMTFPS